MYGPPGTGKTLFAKVKIPGCEGGTGFGWASHPLAAFFTGSQSTAVHLGATSSDGGELSMLDRVGWWSCRVGTLKGTSALFPHPSLLRNLHCIQAWTTPS